MLTATNSPFQEIQLVPVNLKSRYKTIIYASGAAVLLAITLLILHATGATEYAKVYQERTSSKAILHSTMQSPFPAQSHRFLEYHLSTSKVASIIEPRNAPALLPILHNFISVLPQDWPVIVWCSDENFNVLHDTRSLKPYLESGKLSLRMLPKEYRKLDGPRLSRFMIEPWLWQQFGEAEHVLIFQLDSVLCSRSDGDLDHWIKYDFVGHPLEWSINGRGGNGGLSMRRVSSMLRVANEYQTRLQESGRKAQYKEFFKEWAHLPDEEKQYNYTAEDAWFVHHLVQIDDAMGENSTIKWPVQDKRSQAGFAFDIWLYEGRPIEQVKPIGVHTGSGFAKVLIKYDGKHYDDKSRKWMEYCPELGLLRFVP